MNNDQRHKYLKSFGSQCPYCESYDITVTDFDPVDNFIYQNCRCEKCEKEWTDQYTLTDVHSEEE